MDGNILNLSQIGVLPSHLEELERSYSYIKDALSRSEEEGVSGVLSLCDQGQRDLVVRGLLFGILSGQNWMDLLHSVCRDDQFYLACDTLARVAPFLKSSHRAVWLLCQLWKIDVPAFPDLLVNFVRNLGYIAELKNEAEWLVAQPICSLIMYHSLRHVTDLSLIMHVWRRRKEHFLDIGRDLLRVLSFAQDAPGLEPIWNDLQSNNREGKPVYSTVLAVPTDVRYHKMLFPHLVEKKVVFVIEQASQSNYQHYLKWILNSCDESLLPDIIRFIITYSPSQENVPRWQIIAWFLRSSKDRQVQANIKQALVYDVLFFGKMDSLSLIEPCMSMLKHSLARYAHLTEELLEFLLKSRDLYDARSYESINWSLKEAFRVSVENGLVPSLAELSQDERLDVSIRDGIEGLISFTSNGSSTKMSENSYTRERSDSFGENGKVFIDEPSIEALYLMLEHNAISEDLARFILSGLESSLAQKLSTEVSGLLGKMFSAAEGNPKMHEAVGMMYMLDTAFGLRLLIYSLKTGSALYFKTGGNLDRDLSSSMVEDEREIQEFIFQELFMNASNLLSSQFVKLFLNVARPEVICKVELDLIIGKYSVVSGYLSDLIRLSVEMSTQVQYYLWKLIVAEVGADRLEEICSALQNSRRKHWEAMSGLISFVHMHQVSIFPEHVAALLILDHTEFKEVVFSAVSILRAPCVEAGLLRSLQSSHSRNAAKHFIYWKTQGMFNEFLNNSAIKNALGEVVGTQGDEPI